MEGADDADGRSSSGRETEGGFAWSPPSRLSGEEETYFVRRKIQRPEFMSLA